jgi:hypothetical protein
MDERGAISGGCKQKTTGFSLANVEKMQRSFEIVGYIWPLISSDRGTEQATPWRPHA